jgi:hypothetical protein
MNRTTHELQLDPLKKRILHAVLNAGGVEYTETLYDLVESVRPTVDDDGVEIDGMDVYETSREEIGALECAGLLGQSDDTMACMGKSILTGAGREAVENDLDAVTYTVPEFWWAEDERLSDEVRAFRFDEEPPSEATVEAFRAFVDAALVKNPEHHKPYLVFDFMYEDDVTVGPLAQLRDAFGDESPEYKILWDDACARAREWAAPLYEIVGGDGE